MDKLLTLDEADDYTGLPRGFVRMKSRQGKGPEFIRVTPRTQFFTRKALDAWMSGWKTVEQQQK